MGLSEQDIKKLLLKHDSEVKLYPVGFNVEQAYAGVAEVKKELETLLKIPIEEVSRESYQDTCYHALLRLPERLGSSQGSSEIRFCNFGNMVSIDYSKNLQSDKLQKITTLLERKGYHYIPQKFLNMKYDGEHDSIDTWWQRFFDYL
ncbi:MAG: hypothetical protein AAGK14_03920 [Verrucomicrobiota bacterium]